MGPPDLSSTVFLAIGQFSTSVTLISKQKYFYFFSNLAAISELAVATQGESFSATDRLPELIFKKYTNRLPKPILNKYTNRLPQLI